MEQQLSQEMCFSSQDGSVAGSNVKPCQPVPNTPSMEDLVHELRQPLGVIESLAYYLQLISPDERMSAHLQRIQAMVLQANRILEQASPLRQAASASN